MSLDLHRLEKVRHGDGKTIAACPVCREVGKDAGCEHLVIYQSGKFGCVVDDSKEHRKRIFELAGEVKPNGHAKPQIVAEYSYTDETGQELFQVVRMVPKTFSQRHRGPDGKWVWKAGPRLVPFKLPSVIDAVREGRTVFIAEGEKDVLALEKEGFTATCNPGGAGKWRPEFNEFLRGAAVVIVSDKDAPGREHAQKVAASLDGVAREIRVIELPDFAGVTVKDAHDFFAAGGGKAGFEAFADRASLWTPRADAATGKEGGGPDEEPPAKPWANWPKPVDLTEWLNKPIPPEPEIILGLLRRGEKMTLGGASKSRKTWMAASMAVAMATGRPWLGFQTVRTPVLFINLELPEAAFQERMTKLRAAVGSALEPGQFTAWNLRGQRVSIEYLEEALEEFRGRFGCIVLDPLYKLLGRRVENSAEDMANLMGHLEAISEKHKAALIVPAHFAKGNQSERESIDRISGSGVFARDADAILTLTAHEQPNCYTLEATLRSFAPVEPFVARWEYPLFHRDGELDPERLKKVGRPPTADPRKLLDLLPAEGMKHSDWRAAAEAAGIPPTTFARVMRKLRDDGVVKNEFGFWKKASTHELGTELWH